jgi:hypothetical protein
MLAAVSYFNLKWPRWELCSLLNPEFFSTLLRSPFSQICPCSNQRYESFQVWRVCLLNWLLKSHFCCRRIFMYSSICTENRNVTALFSELNGVVLFCLFSTFSFFVWTVVWENVHGFLSSRTIHTSLYNSNFVFYLSLFVYALKFLL